MTSKRKYKRNEKYFEKINTEEKAYWLGFLYADGCLYKQKTGYGYNFELSLKESDKYHIENFLKTIECDVPVKKKLVRLGDKTYTSYRVMFFCREFAEHLIDKGCYPNKSLTLKFPSKEIVPDKLMKHFIRGYFDGDGCVCFGYKYNNIIHKKCFSPSMSIVGTKDMLESIQNILIRDAKLTKTKIFGKGRTFQFFWSGTISAQKFYNYCYVDASACLERKVEIFNNIFAHTSSDTRSENGENR